MPFLPTMPAGATLLDVFKAFPEASRPLIEFHEAVLRGPSPFSEAVRRCPRDAVATIRATDRSAVRIGHSHSGEINPAIEGRCP